MIHAKKKKNILNRFSAQLSLNLVDLQSVSGTIHHVTKLGDILLGLCVFLYIIKKNEPVRDDGDWH